MPNFRVRLANDDMVFSAGHFVVLADGQCEPLHGHDYRAAAEVLGPLDENHYVVDFHALRRALKGILAGLDHRVLLPAAHPSMRVSARHGEVEVRLADRRWVFPVDNCMLLPIVNTSTELLAQYVAERLQAALAGLGGDAPEMIRVEISESAGASAVCELR
jgi:6-pyruvoyltetrahydropterin/6-carboxytetrahydropterin synthase